jgi:hypothetical protein
MSNSTSSRRMPARKPRNSIDRQTHKLPHQTCVLWLPDARGYAADFGPGVFEITSHPDLAHHLTEDEAEDLALRMRSELGMRASIRPYYAQARG